MQNKGMHQYRFGSNPIEKLFAEKWEEINTSPLSSFGIVDYILADDNIPTGGLSDRDREVAATVIQWLGSPVGQDFLRDVQEGEWDE